MAPVAKNVPKDITETRSVTGVNPVRVRRSRKTSLSLVKSTLMGDSRAAANTATKEACVISKGRFEFRFQNQM